MNLTSGNMWFIWGLLSIALASYLGYRMFGEDKEIYLIGKTTDGHYQMELACSACHKESFVGMDSLQESCMDCHGEELKTSDDSHPRSKFTDPRNADRVKNLDARLCVTCHREHNEDITRPMAVTLPDDFCFRCHEDIGEDRATHKDLAFDTCASAGCHNFHDNRALYEDFLVKHGSEPAILENKKVARRNLGAWRKQFEGASVKHLTASGHDSKSNRQVNPLLLSDWEKSAHARSGVNCTGCHARDDKGNTVSWQDNPGFTACTSCHEKERGGFTAGKHGMRQALGLSAMTPDQARQPMHSDVADKTLNCGSCHSMHEASTTTAAVDACTGCHNDEHTRAYRKSSHFGLWQDVIQGKRPEEQGVSCATCHMPRRSIVDKGIERTLVEHNQNDNLRPNEKMIRSVCMNCHGLGFSINALADPALVKNNFSGKPAVHIKSIDWALGRVGKKQISN